MKIYKVTNAQLKALLEAGSITVGGVTYTYNPEDVYVVTDGFPEYRISKNSKDPSFITLSKDGIVVASTQITEALHALNSDHANSLYEEINTQQEYETVASIRKKTVAPLVTADTVLTADLAQNIVAVGYFETGTEASNERWFVMQDATLNQSDKWLEAFRWDAYDTTIVYTVSWNLNGKWSSAEVINYPLASIDDVDKKLDKVTTVDTTKLYMKNANGTQGMIALSQSPSGNSVVHRDANGKSQIATPTDSDSVKSIANVEYVKNKLANKLDKVTSQGGYRVYAISGAGSQGTVDYSPSSTGSTIMSRDAQGKAQVATPTASDSVKSIANVEYVKNNSSKLTVTDNEDGTVTLNIV